MAEEVATNEELITERSGRRTFTGLVVSDKGDKTIIVNVSTKKKHPLYKKYIAVDKKLHAHDEQNTAGAGDTVEIQEVTRKLSKLKRYELVRIVERAK